MRDKNNRVSFVLRDLLSKLQSVLSKNGDHCAICQKTVNGKYFDLIRKFNISDKIVLSLLIPEDFKNAKQGFYFELYRYISGTGKDKKELVIRSNKLDYDELKLLLKALIMYSKGNFIQKLKENSIIAFAKKTNERNERLVRFNNYFGSDLEIFMLSDEMLIKNGENASSVNTLDKNELLNGVNKNEVLTKEKEKKSSQFKSNKVKSNDPEYLALLEKRAEIEKQIAIKEKEIFG